MSDQTKEQLKALSIKYQSLKAIGLDIIKSLQKYIENTDGIQNISYSKVTLNFALLDVSVTVAIEFPEGAILKQTGIIKTLYSADGTDKLVPLPQSFQFDNLGNIESRYTQSDFPPVYLKFILDNIAQKIRVTPLR